MNLTDELSYVKRGKNRRLVLLAIEGSMIPSEISRAAFGDASASAFSITSRAPAEFVDRGLVEILNPDERTGRLYRRTGPGDRVAKLL